MNDFPTSKDPFEEYRRVAGEVESRAVERRAGLNQQQRRDNYPFEYGDYGYDVVPEHQNIQFEQNISKSQRPLTEFEQAHLTAQRNAALPVNQGGLGLALLVPTTALGAYMYNENRKKSQGKQ